IINAQFRKSMPEVPPGYDPVAHTKHKTKSPKRNEPKKEKKHQEYSRFLLQCGCILYETDRGTI
ncbi:hypothetical protein SUGI_0820450, partial [Cryptomeria japonica]